MQHAAALSEPLGCSGRVGCGGQRKAQERAIRGNGVSSILRGDRLIADELLMIAGGVALGIGIGSIWKHGSPALCGFVGGVFLAAGVAMALLN